MAKKSSGAAKDAATTPKAGKKAGVKKTAVKKATKPKAETASKSGTPKAAAKKSAPKAAAKTTTKKAAPKKAAGPKLNDRQVEFLKKIHGAGDAGYAAGKGDDRTLDALSTRKLVKKGKKNPTTGKHHHHLTKMGEKHAGSSGSAAPTSGA
jgi:hypothetical protein